MIFYADCVIGLSYGDEGKGKVTAHLASNYDIVARWAGGNNAGHTVFVNGNKYKTHLIPSGVFYNKLSVIGPGCVLHPESFFKEIDYLSNAGFDTSVIKVHPSCHIVLDEHIQYDKENLAEKLGTTSKGIAPCYASKAARTGVLAKDVLNKSFILDPSSLTGRMLCEGAQGVWLDVDHGNYPYVTSSNTLPYAACSIGFPPQKIRRIYGCAKIYDTKSGVDPEFPKSLLDDPILLKIGDIGQEYGVTTGRRRIVNWLNLDKLIKSVNLSGTTRLIVSKCDILEKLKSEIPEQDLFIKFNDQMHSISKLEDYLIFVDNKVKSSCTLVSEIKFSSSPETI